MISKVNYQVQVPQALNILLSILEFILGTLEGWH